MKFKAVTQNFLLSEIPRWATVPKFIVCAEALRWTDS